jgi:hypothetical protein
MKLSQPERRLAAMVFDEILPRGASERLPMSASDAGVVDFFEQHLDYLPPRTRWALRTAVAMLGGYARAVGTVHPRGVRGALELLSDSKLYAMREAITLLKSVVSMGYFSNPKVRHAAGLDATLADVAWKAPS